MNRFYPYICLQYCKQLKIFLYFIVCIYERKATRNIILDISMSWVKFNKNSCVCINLILRYLVNCPSRLSMDIVCCTDNGNIICGTIDGGMKQLSTFKKISNRFATNSVSLVRSGINFFLIIILAESLCQYAQLSLSVREKFVRKEFSQKLFL